MDHRVLCPSCGTTNVVRFKLWAGRCGVCKTRLPYTWPRIFTYVARSLWRPLTIALFLFIVLVVAPQMRGERPGYLGILGHTFTFDIFRQPHTPPIGVKPTAH